MKRFIQKHKKLFVLSGLAIAVLGLGASVPQTTGDGTAKYTGAKLEAARLMLDRFDPHDDGLGTIPGLSKLRVEDVTYTPRDSHPSCKDPDNYYSYTVTLQTVWWFGITTNKMTDSICRYFGG